MKIQTTHIYNLYFHPFSHQLNPHHSYQLHNNFTCMLLLLIQMHNVPNRYVDKKMTNKTQSQLYLLQKEGNHLFKTIQCIKYKYVQMMMNQKANIYHYCRSSGVVSRKYHRASLALYIVKLNLLIILAQHTIIQ